MCLVFYIECVLSIVKQKKLKESFFLLVSAVAGQVPGHSSRVVHKQQRTAEHVIRRLN